MSIKQLDLFHGAILSKITRNKKNKISLVVWDERENRALYKVETERSNDLSILIKYDATARIKNKNKILAWDFVNLAYRKNCYFCLVCIESKVIDGDTIMEVCAISPEQIRKLFTREEIKQENTISCVVSLEKGKSFRVSRKQKDIEIIVKRKAIDNI